MKLNKIIVLSIFSFISIGASNFGDLVGLKNKKSLKYLSISSLASIAGSSGVAYTKVAPGEKSALSSWVLLKDPGATTQGAVLSGGAAAQGNKVLLRGGVINTFLTTLGNSAAQALKMQFGFSSGTNGLYLEKADDAGMVIGYQSGDSKFVLVERNSDYSFVPLASVNIDTADEAKFIVEPVSAGFYDKNISLNNPKVDVLKTKQDPRYKFLAQANLAPALNALTGNEISSIAACKTQDGVTKLFAVRTSDSRVVSVGRVNPTDEISLISVGNIVDGGLDTPAFVDKIACAGDGKLIGLDLAGRSTSQNVKSPLSMLTLDWTEVAGTWDLTDQSAVDVACGAKYVVIVKNDGSVWLKKDGEDYKSVALPFTAIAVSMTDDGSYFIVSSDGELYSMTSGGLVYATDGKKRLSKSDSNGLVVKVASAGTADSNICVACTSLGKVMLSKGGGDFVDLNLPVAQDIALTEDQVLYMIVKVPYANYGYLSCVPLKKILEPGSFAAWDATAKLAAATPYTGKTDMVFFKSAAGKYLSPGTTAGTVVSLSTQNFGNYFSLDRVDEVGQFRIICNDQYLIVRNGTTLMFVPEVKSTDSDLFFVYGNDSAVKIRYNDKYLAIDGNGNVVLQAGDFSWTASASESEKMAAAAQAMLQISKQQADFQKAQQAALDAVAVQVNALKQQLISQKLDADRAKLQTQIDALTAKNVQLQKDLVDAQAKKAAALAKITAANKEHDEQMAMLNQKIADLQAQVTAEKDPTKKATLQSQLDKLKSAGDNLTNVLFDNAKTIADQNNQYSELLKQKAILESQIASGQAEATAQVNSLKAMYSADVQTMIDQSAIARFDRISRALGVSTSAFKAAVKTADEITTIDALAGKLSIKVEDAKKNLFVVYNVDQLVRSVVSACGAKIADALGLKVEEFNAKIQPGTDLSSASDWDGLAKLFGKGKDLLQKNIIDRYKVATIEEALPVVLNDLKLVTQTDNKSSDAVISAAKKDVSANNTAETAKIFGTFVGAASNIIAIIAKYDAVAQIKSDYQSGLKIQSTPLDTIVNNFKADVDAFAKALGSTYDAIVEAVTKSMDDIAKVVGKDIATVTQQFNQGFTGMSSVFGADWATDSNLISKIVGYKLMEAKYQSQVADLEAKKADIKAKYLDAVTKNESLRAQLVVFLGDRQAEQEAIDKRIIDLRRRLADASTSFDMMAFVEQVDSLKSSNQEIMKKLHENEAKIFQRQTEIAKQEQTISLLSDILKDSVAQQEQFISDALKDSLAAKADLTVALVKYTVEDRINSLGEVLEQAWQDVRCINIAKAIGTQVKANTKIALVKEVLLVDRMNLFLADLNSASKTEDQKMQLVTQLAAEIKAINRETLSSYASDATDGEAILKIILRQFGCEAFKERSLSVANVVLKLEKEVYQAAQKVNSDKVAEVITDCCSKSLALETLGFDKVTSSYLNGLIATLVTDLKAVIGSELALAPQKIRAALEKFYLGAFDYSVLLQKDSGESLEALGLVFLKDLYAKSYLKVLTGATNSGIVSTDIDKVIQSLIIPVVQSDIDALPKVMLFETSPDMFEKITQKLADDSVDFLKSVLTSPIDFYKVWMQSLISQYEIEKRVNVTPEGIDAKRQDLIDLQNAVLKYRTDLMTEIQSKGTAAIASYEKAKALVVEKRVACENNKATLVKDYNDFLAKASATAAANKVSATADQATIDAAKAAMKALDAERAQRLVDFNDKSAVFDAEIKNYSVRESLLSSQASMVQTLIAQKQKDLLNFMRETNEKQKSQMYEALVEATEAQKIQGAKKIAEMDAKNKSGMDSLTQLLKKNEDDAISKNQAILDAQKAQVDDWKKRELEAEALNKAQEAAVKLATEIQGENKAFFLSWTGKAKDVSDQKISSLSTLASTFENDLGKAPANFDENIEALVNGLKKALPTVPVLYPILGLDPSTSFNAEQISNNKINNVVDKLKNNLHVGLPVVIGVKLSGTEVYAFLEKTPSGLWIQQGANIFDNLKFKMTHKTMYNNKPLVTIQSIDGTGKLTLVKDNIVSVSQPVPLEGFKPVDASLFIIKEDKSDSLIVESKKFDSITFTLRKVVDFKEPTNNQAHSYYLVPIKNKFVSIENELSSLSLSLKKIDEKTVWFHSTADCKAKVNGQDVPGLQVLTVSDATKSFAMVNEDLFDKDRSQWFIVDPADDGSFTLQNLLENDYVNVVGTIGTAQVASSAKIVPADKAARLYLFTVPNLTFEEEFRQLTDVNNPNSISKRFEVFKASLTPAEMASKFATFKTTVDNSFELITNAQKQFRTDIQVLSSAAQMAVLDALLSAKIIEMDKVLGDLSRAVPASGGKSASTVVDMFNSISKKWLKEEIEEIQKTATNPIPEDVKMKLFSAIDEYARQVSIAAQIKKEQCQRMQNLKRIYVQTTVDKNKNIGELEADSVWQKFSWAYQIYQLSQQQMNVSERAKQDFQAEMDKTLVNQKEKIADLEAQKQAALAAQKKAMEEKQAAAKKAADELKALQEANAKVFADQMAKMQAEFDATKSQMSSAEQADRKRRLDEAAARFKMESDNLNKKLTDQKAAIEAETLRLKALAEGKSASMELQIKTAQQFLLSYKIDTNTTVAIAYQPNKNTENSFFKATTDMKIPSSDGKNMLVEVSQKAIRFDQNARLKVVAQDQGSFSIETLDAAPKRLTIIGEGQVIFADPMDKKNSDGKSFAEGSQSFFIEGSEKDGVVIRDFYKIGFLTVKSAQDVKKGSVLAFTTLKEQMAQAKGASAIETKFYISKMSEKSGTIEEVLVKFFDSKDKIASVDAIAKAQEFFDKNKIYDYPALLDNFVEAVIEFGQGRMAKGLMTEAAVKKSNDFLDSINKKFMYTVSAEGTITVDKDSAKLMDKTFVEPISVNPNQLIAISYNSTFLSGAPDADKKAQFIPGGIFTAKNFFRVVFTEGAEKFSIENLDGKNRLSVNGDAVEFVSASAPADDRALFSVTGTRFGAAFSNGSKQLSRVQGKDNVWFLNAQDAGPEAGFNVVLFNKNSFEEYIVLNGLEVYDAKQESRVAIDKLSNKLINSISSPSMADEDKQALLQTFANYLQNYVSVQAMPLFAAAVAKIAYVAQTNIPTLDKTILAKLSQSTTAVAVDSLNYVSLMSNVNQKYCKVNPDGTIGVSDDNNSSANMFRVVKVDDKYAFVASGGLGGYLTYGSDVIVVSKDKALDKDGKAIVAPSKNQLFSLMGNNVNLIIKSATVDQADDSGFIGMHENNVLTYWDLFSPTKKPAFSSADLRTKFTLEIIGENSVKFGIVNGKLETLPRILLESMLEVADDDKLSDEKKSLKAEQILKDFEKSIFNREVIPATDKTKKPIIKYSLKNQFLSLQSIITNMDKDLYSFDDAFQNIKTHVLYSPVGKTGVKLSSDAQLIFDSLLTSFSSAGRSQKLITTSAIDELVSPRGVSSTDPNKDLIGEALDSFAAGKTDLVELVAIVYAYVLRLARYVYGQGYVDNSLNFKFNNDGQGKMLDKDGVEYKLKADGRFVSKDGKEFADVAPILNADGKPTGRTQAFTPGIVVKSANGGFEFAFKGDSSSFQTDPSMIQDYKNRVNKALDNFIFGNSTSVKFVSNLKPFLLQIQAQTVGGNYSQIKETLLKDFKDAKDSAAMLPAFDKLMQKVLYRMPYESIEWKRDLAVVLYDLSGKKATFTLGKDKNYTVKIEDGSKVQYQSANLEKVLAVLTKDVTAITLKDGQVSVEQKYKDLLDSVVKYWLEGDKTKANSLLKNFKDDKLAKDWDIKTSPSSWWIGGVRPLPKDGSDDAKSANESERKRPWNDKTSKYLIRLLTPELMQKRIKVMQFIARTPNYKKPKSAVAATPKTPVATPAAKVAPLQTVPVAAAQQNTAALAQPQLTKAAQAAPVVAVA